MIFWCDRLVFISLCLLVAVLPFSTAGVEIFSSTAILCFLLQGAAALKTRTSEGGASFFRLGSINPLTWSGYNQALSMFLLVSFVSAFFFSQYPDLSRKAFFFKTVQAVFLFVLTEISFTTPGRSHWFLRAFFAAVLVLCADAFWQMFTGADLFKGILLSEGTRLSASFHHANGLGGYLLLALFPCAALAAWRRSFLWVMCLLFIAAVFGLSFSRGAWLGGVAGVLILVFLCRRSGLFLLGLFVLSAAVFLPLMIHKRGVSLLADTEGSVNVVAALKKMNGMGRKAYWRDALRIIADQPLTGTGLNTYTQVIKKYTVKNQNYAHNCYLQMAAELGLPGVLAFFWFAGTVIVFVRRSMKTIRTGSERALLAGFLAGWCALLVHSAVDTILYTAQHSAMFWVVGGFLVVFAKELVKNKEKSGFIDTNVMEN